MADRQQFHRAIEFAVQVEQHAKMVLSDSDRFWTFLNAEPLGLFEVNQGVLVVLGFVFAQSQQCPRGTKVRSQADYMLQRFDRTGVLPAAKIDEAQITPTFL